jgi:ketosteroid isomerase-like protein
MCTICLSRSSAHCRSALVAYFIRQGEDKPMPMKSAFAFLMVTMVLSSAMPTVAQNSAQREAQDVVTRQLEAFLAGDFETAYSFASPDIKRIFPTLDGFMSMVRNGYLPVLRPGNYAFGQVETDVEGRLVWEVLIKGPDGSDYTAAYYMERQPDGSWKVDAVSLRKGAAGMT